MWQTHPILGWAFFIISDNILQKCFDCDRICVRKWANELFSNQFCKGERSLPIHREIAVIAGAEMPFQENWALRRCRYAPENGSKGRVCIAAGIHGDEMMGQLICFEIAAHILKEPEKLAGIIDIYPMLNPLGLDIGERMVPVGTRLDMNLAFPGSENGTPLEILCYQIMQDMLGADLVLDIHASTQFKSELYEVRMNEADAERLIPKARALCPELIWVYPAYAAYGSSLVSALGAAGTDALILEADERRRKPKEIAEGVVSGIFCKLKEMGIWVGETREIPDEIPIVRTREDICRVTCAIPGVYVPEDHIGKRVSEGEVLGCVVDALEGTIRETVKAPVSGLVFTQRSYSAVYPGTLIARIRKEPT